jgi:hypothetical protein
VSIQVVSPYRPFPPESVEHHNVGPFDWEGALRMLASSVEQSCGCPTYAITDVDTTLSVPAWRFRTRERRLMLWILEVSLRYLESRHFDRDTVMISPDMLVRGDIRPWFTADLGILVRPEEKFQEPRREILNQAQWWRHSAKRKLAAFYRRALAIARTLPEPLLTWGADTEPIRQLVEPLEIGIVERQGLSVALIDAGEPMESLSGVNINRLAYGKPLKLGRPILDFRYTRKHHMRAVYDALFPSEVSA